MAASAAEGAVEVQADLGSERACQPVLGERQAIVVGLTRSRYAVVVDRQQFHPMKPLNFRLLRPHRSPRRFRGGHLPLKTPFFGVQCLGTALESGDLSPHSKRTSSEKASIGDKIGKFGYLPHFTKLPYRR